MTSAAADTSLPVTAFDEELRAKQLNEMKLRAAGLLVLAAIAFAISHYLRAQYPWLAWVQAFSEAAMVGGLADWFAVTALFRHPLGIPIPHTAIIPARKDRVGELLGAFVERNFLNRNVIERRILEARLGEQAADVRPVQGVAARAVAVQPRSSPRVERF